jgi:hypothetical protein
MLCTANGEKLHLEYRRKLFRTHTAGVHHCEHILHWVHLFVYVIKNCGKTSILYFCQSRGTQYYTLL